jgi:hypothetical protein
MLIIPFTRCPQVKEGSFKVVQTLCDTAPEAVQAALPDIVPMVRLSGPCFL